MLQRELARKILGACSKNIKARLQSGGIVVSVAEREHWCPPGNFPFAFVQISRRAGHGSRSRHFDGPEMTVRDRLSKKVSVSIANSLTSCAVTVGFV